MSDNDTNVRCSSYTENEACNSEGKTKFSMSTITVPVSYIIIIMYFVIFFITIIISVTTFIFYVWYQMINVHNLILESDEFNLKKMKLHEMYYYQFYNYVHCFDEPTEEKKNLKQKPKSYFDYSTSDTCYYNEPPYAKITLINDLYNFQLNLMIYILTIFIITAILSWFLPILNARGYIIVGKSVMTLTYEYIWVFVSFGLILFFILLNGIVYKFYFIDGVISNLFYSYNKMLELDNIVYTELTKCIDSSNKAHIFYGYLKNIPKDNFNSDFIIDKITSKLDVSDTDNIKKIIKDIIDEKSDDRKASKIFMFTIYIYIVNQNIDNTLILDIIRDILEQKDNNIYTFRSLLPLELSDKKIIFELNSIVSFLGEGIFKNQEGTIKTSEQKKADYLSEWETTQKAVRVQPKEDLKTNAQIELDKYTKKNENHYFPDLYITDKINAFNKIIADKKDDGTNTNTDYKNLKDAVVNAQNALNAANIEFTKCITITDPSDPVSDKLKSLTTEISTYTDASGKSVSASVTRKEIPNDETYKPTKKLDDPKLASQTADLSPVIALLKELQTRANLQSVNIKKLEDDLKNAIKNRDDYYNNIIVPLDAEIVRLNNKALEYSNEIAGYDKDIEAINAAIAADRAVLVTKLDTEPLNTTNPQETEVANIGKYADAANIAATVYTDIFSKKSPDFTSKITNNHIERLKSILPDNILTSDDVTSNSDLKKKITYIVDPDPTKQDKTILTHINLQTLLKKTSIGDKIVDEADLTKDDLKLLLNLREYKETLLQTETTKYEKERISQCQNDVNEFKTFNFIKVDYANSLTKTLAEKLRSFYTTLMKINNFRDELRIDTIVKNMNMTLVSMWLLSTVLILFLLMILWAFSQKNDTLKKGIEFVITAITLALDEFVWGVIL